MSSESESTDLDREVDASMRMFEKSKVGPAATILPITPARVLLVLDGSSQDQTATRAAQHLRERFNTETLILDARDSPSDAAPESLAPGLVESISGSRPLERAEGDSYDAILAAIDAHQCDLVIVPCPYGRSFEHVGGG